MLYGCLYIYRWNFDWSDYKMILKLFNHTQVDWGPCCCWSRIHVECCCRDCIFLIVRHFFLLHFYVPLLVYLFLYRFFLCTVRRMICILFGILFHFYLDPEFCLLNGIILNLRYVLAYSLILYCMVSKTCSLVPKLLWCMVLKYTDLFPCFHYDY